MPSAKNMAKLANKRKSTKTDSKGRLKHSVGHEYECSLIRAQRLKFLVYGYLHNVHGIDVVSKSVVNETIDTLRKLHNKHLAVAQMTVYADLCMPLDYSLIDEYPEEIIEQAKRIAKITNNTLE